MAAHNEIGKWGEAKAEEYLRRQGMRILWRNWRYVHRDLDIVAEDHGELVIVEVKTRRDTAFRVPEQAVDARKIRNLCVAAQHLVRSKHIDMPVRFDIVTVVGWDDDHCTIEHIANAFLPLPY